MCWYHVCLVERVVGSVILLKLQTFPCSSEHKKHFHFLLYTAHAHIHITQKAVIKQSYVTARLSGHAYLASLYAHVSFSMRSRGRTQALIPSSHTQALYPGSRTQALVPGSHTQN